MMRDAIVFSGWTWQTFNVPERIALALCRLGSRVLYCERPLSLIKPKKRSLFRGLKEVEPNIFVFQPVFLGSRINSIPLGGALQAKWIARQLLNMRDQLGLRETMFVYPWMGKLWPLCAAMREAGNFMVHVHMDYFEENSDLHVDLSDRTLVVQKTTYHRLKSRFGEKIIYIPQPTDFMLLASSESLDCKMGDVLNIPSPRLGYLGPVHGRLNTTLVAELLVRHPEWNFICFGQSMCSHLPNVYCLPWKSRRELSDVIRAFDVGFMPYYLYDEQQLHCTPLKLFDYFAVGLPVVSTPLIELWEFRELIYFGDTVDEIEQAVMLALQEPEDDVRRERRREIARSHSIEKVASILKEVLCE